jgi:hypothetical protein
MYQIVIHHVISKVDGRIMFAIHEDWLKWQRQKNSMTLLDLQHKSRLHLRYCCIALLSLDYKMQAPSSNGD